MARSPDDAIVVVTRTVDETRAVAATVARALRPGDLVLLGGDLGAGKTAFTQGLGRALGVTAPIVSPTFTIERIYEGDVELHHLDVYRLERLHELLDLGLAEALEDGAVAVVEWGEAVGPVIDRDALVVELALGDGDDDRTLTLHAQGASWQARMGELRTHLDPGAPGERS